MSARRYIFVLLSAAKNLCLALTKDPSLLAQDDSHFVRTLHPTRHAAKNLTPCAASAALSAKGGASYKLSVQPALVIEIKEEYFLRSEQSPASERVASHRYYIDCLRPRQLVQSAGRFKEHIYEA